MSAVEKVEQVANSLQGFSTSAATFAKDIDEAFWIHIWISVVLFIAVIGPMLYFAWKYRESNVKDEDIVNFTHHTGLEVAWTAIPTALLMVMFWYGYTSMQALRTMPTNEDRIVIDLEGRKWSWNYTYANGKKTHELYVPVGENIILNMSAPLDDVIHAYFVPAFRMKEDVVPGRVTKQWFNSEVIGTYDVECAEYCGTSHAYMASKVHVMKKADYEAWYNSADTVPAQFAKPMSKGQESFEVNGCNSCHSTSTDKIIYGPSLKTRSLTKDQVLDVINNGQDKLGYATGAMPAGLATGADAEAISAYVAGGMKGDKPASFSKCSSCHGEDGSGKVYGMVMAPSLVNYDADLVRNVLKNGKKGRMTTMPAFPNLSKEEVSEIAKYLQDIK